MQSKEQFCNFISDIIPRAGTAALAIALVFALTVVLTQSAQAQTFKVIYNFTGGADGATPLAGLTTDKAGNLYGTAAFAGAHGWGTVFKLSHRGSGWLFNTLYAFAGGYGGYSDGANPEAAVVFGPDGSLYGTTVSGGHTSCGSVGEAFCGTVFNLKPAPTACKTALCPWTETVVYFFEGELGGSWPTSAVFDPAGNMYISTQEHYVIVGLTASNGVWQEAFSCWSGGDWNLSGLILDAAGNMYGALGDYYQPGGDVGVVFEATRAGSSCTVKLLYSFQGGSDGTNPNGGLIWDNSGNLYGGTVGSSSVGTVYELTPSGGGQWTESVLYRFPYQAGQDYPGPIGSLTMDAAGNLYGATQQGAYGFGSVFKLTHSGGSWTYTSLYDFTGGSDGINPNGSLILDANGNIYGTTSSGGSSGNGVVFEITP